MYSIAGRRIASAVRRSRRLSSVLGLRISSRASSEASVRSRLSGIERDSTGVPVFSAEPIGGSVLVSSAEGARSRRASSVESSRKPRLARRLVVPWARVPGSALDRRGQRGGVAVERGEGVGAGAQRRGGGGRHRRHLPRGRRRSSRTSRPRRVRRSESVAITGVSRRSSGALAAIDSFSDSPRPASASPRPSVAPRSPSRVGAGKAS